MKQKLIFATHNKHKLQEIKAIAANKFEILGLDDLGFHEDIPEPHPTIEANAIEKAMFIYNKFGYTCFADDTGLEVEALNGAPGVYSARYAGEGKNFDDNIQKLLKEMKGINNRKARFITVIALVEQGMITTFEGIVNGTIIEEKSGTGGFGYDPVFLPENEQRTYAEMSADEKNKFSHRALAMQKLLKYLHVY